MLTGDYMPEYGRVSGGQIRMVTKSGGNRFSGSGSFFYRDDKLQANTWTRNHSANLADRSTAPFNYKQYGYSAGGPILKDKLFFFAAQEWVNYLAQQTNLATVPTAKMRTGDFSELLSPNAFFSGITVIRNPATGQPFPNNVIPQNLLSANGLAMLSAYPAPDARLPAGRVQRDRQQRQPAGSAEGQLPRRLPPEREQHAHLPLRQVQLDGGGRVPRHLPVRAHRLGSPEHDADGELDEHDQEQPGERSDLYLLARPGVHQRVPERPLQAQQVRHHLSRTSSRRTRRFRTRSRRSRSTTSPRSTAVRIPPRRRVRSTRFADA